MTTATNPAVSEYLARAHTALADLPGSEVEEILEDIGPHVAEVAAELGEQVTVDALTARLGTPEQYASELRAAAGYPPAAPGSRPVRPSHGLARFAMWSLVLTSLFALGVGLGFPNLSVDLIGPGLLLNLPLFIALMLVFAGQVTPAAVAGLPEYRAGASALRGAGAALPGNAGTYLRSLRPAWWLIRIVVLAAAVLFAIDHGKAPQIGSAITALAVLLWAGARARRDRRWNWLVVPANVFTAGLIVALVFVAWNGLVGHQYPIAAGEPSYQPTFQPGPTVDGRPVRNIYVFGADGKPLIPAYLYDQDGLPIMGTPMTCAGPGEPTNRYPLPRTEYSDGLCRTMTGVPFTVAVPASPGSTTTTTTTATPPPVTRPPAPTTTTRTPPPTTAPPPTTK